MNKHLLALSLALTLVPVAAAAQDANPPAAPPAPPTAAQRQAMYQTFETFHKQEAALHQQLRAQVLNSLTPGHRQAIASIVGGLAIAPSPDPATAAKQIDAILSQGEQQRILAASTSFHTQSKALHEQMRSQMEKQMGSMPMPPGHPGMMGMHEGMRSGQHAKMASDAGTLVLMILGHDGPEHHMGFPKMGGMPRRR